MKTLFKSPYVSPMRLMVVTTLMFLAGIVAWWSWTQTGQGGFLYAAVGLIIVVAAAAFLGRSKIYGTNRRQQKKVG